MGGALDTTKGILLCGPIGTGKSTLMKGLQKYESLVNRYGFAYGRKDLGFSFVSAAEISLRYAEQGIDGIMGFFPIFTPALYFSFSPSIKTVPPNIPKGG